MSQFNTLSIQSIKKETEDAVSISFEIPDDIRKRYEFKPGQYLTLRADIDGLDVRRAYSICSGLDDGEIRVAVRRVEGGVFSTFANDELSEGMKIDVMPPAGRFIVDPHSETASNYVAFASGSGITPIISIAKSVLAREPQSNLTLFYGNRGCSSIIFREDLEDLKDRFTHRFSLVHILSREWQDIDLFHGRLDARRIEHFSDFGLFNVDKTDAFLICGPGDMIETTKKVLLNKGVQAEKILSEQFTPVDGGKAKKIRPGKIANKLQAGAEIQVILDGSNRSFTMNEGDETLIDSAHRQGIELPFSCKGGMCCTCRAKLLEGEVQMINNFSLEPWELEAGYILICQSVPLASKVVIDCDDA